MRPPTTFDQVQRRMIERDMARRIRQPVLIALPDSLLHSGCEFRSLRQMPVTYGAGDTVRNIIGSAHHLQLNVDGLHAEIRWASDFQANRIRERFERHELTLALQHHVIDEIRGYNGETIVTRWQPIRLELVPQ